MYYQQKSLLDTALPQKTAPHFVVIKFEKGEDFQLEIKVEGGKFFEIKSEIIDESNEVMVTIPQSKREGDLLSFSNNVIINRIKERLPLKYRDYHISLEVEEGI